MVGRSERQTSRLVHEKTLSVLCGLLMDAVLGRKDTSRELSSIDWFSVINLAQRRRTISTLANSHLTKDPDLPEGVRQMLTDLSLGTTRHNRAVGEQLAEIAWILNAAGVVPMLLKGAAHMASRLYPDAAMRQFTDIDILIPEAELARAAECLAAAGYVSHGAFSNPRWHHWPPLVRAGRPLFLELHRWPIAYPYSQFFDSNLIYRESEFVDLSGSTVRVPSDYHSALLTIAHAELSDRNYLLGRYDLRRLLDLALLMRRSPETVSEASLAPWFIGHRAGVAFDYHRRWLALVDGREPSPEASRISNLLYRRARLLDRYPRLLSTSVRLTRPFIALNRDLGDTALRRELGRRLLQPTWWRTQLSLFSERQR